MKKILLTVTALFILSGISYSQNASTYFPANTGYKWYYKNTPLDSLNNPMPTLARYRVDSFAVVQNYNGLQANIVRKKDNLLTINQNTPYNDTGYHNFQGTNGWEYMNMSLIPDTTGLPIGILNFFRGMQGWYNLFQFASNVGSTYQIITKDTTILISTTQVHLRVKVNATRLTDEQVSTVNGNYLAKKFVVNFGVYIVIIIVELPIVIRPDTTWIAPAVWMVKDESPSVNMDLSSLGYTNFNIPGQIYELTPAVGINNISTEVPSSFALYQNYPNPFNPNTIIRFKIKESRFVTLKVYDALGREAAVLVNEKLNAGEYQAAFNARGLTSGVYFYKLTAGDYVQTRKMVLFK